MPLWVWIVGGLVLLGITAYVILELPPQNRFIDAVGSGKLDKVLQALDSGVDPNKPGTLGLRALQSALQEKQHDVARLLLERGADPNAKVWGILPLHDAAMKNDLEAMELLLEGGADPLAAWSPILQDAIIEPKPDVLRLMLKHGVSLEDQTGFEEGTPLMLLVANAVTSKKRELMPRYLEVLDLFIEKGVNLNARSHEGVPILAVALGQPQVLRRIVEAGAITDVSWEGADLKDTIDQILKDNPA